MWIILQSKDDDQDFPVQTGGKFVIDQEIAKKRALEEKENTEAKPNGQAIKSSSAQTGKLKAK